MGIFVAGGIVLGYWIVSIIEGYKDEKDYQKYQKKLKELGLK